jgi:hypothetical protein
LIADNEGTGRGGGGRGGIRCGMGSACLMMTTTTTNTATQRMGRGHMGERRMGGESDNNGHDIVRSPSFGGVGHRTLIVRPHAPAAVIDNNNDNNCHRGGGALCPPPLVRPIPPDAAHCCRCCQLRLTAAAWGCLGYGHMRGGGGGGQCHCTHLSGSDPPPGWTMGEEEWCDVGGITW